MNKPAPLTCPTCAGEGRIYKSKYGGNDPDVWDAGPCEDCGGDGNRKCISDHCGDDATALNGDGEPMCPYCLAEWQADYAESMS